jgi:ribosome-associated protein
MNHKETKTKARTLGTWEMLKEILKLIEEKKGEQTVILDLEGSPIETDYFVITEADNPKQLRAIAENVLEGLPQEPLALEGLSTASAWIVLDYGDVMVHVFERQARRFYDLEGLWGEKPLQLNED